jgi:hypothetical protein
MQRLFARCRDEDRDPGEMLARFTRELQLIRVTNPPLVQRLYHEFAADHQGDDEQVAHVTCRWCRDRDLWGDDWCGWVHWFVCDDWGSGCVECAGEPAERGTHE